jgi:amino acid transporter
MSALLVGSCFGSAFAALLGYSRVPYGAARYGHFFGVLGRVHPGLRVPHVSLGLVCGLTAFWTFFNLEAIIPAIIVTRILEQFAAQVGALLLLRAYRPELPRPFRMWLYPLPALAALAGWMYVYAASGWFFVALGSLTLLVGAVAFLLWAAATRTWPFAGR